MDFEKMNQRAYDRKPEPDGLTPAERMIWLARGCCMSCTFTAA